MPWMAVKVVVLTATRDVQMGRVAEYNGLLVYHNEDDTTSPTDWPILGWIIASSPRAVSGGKFMTLIFCKEGLNMVIIDQAMGSRCWKFATQPRLPTRCRHSCQGI